LAGSPRHRILPTVLTNDAARGPQSGVRRAFGQTNWRAASAKKKPTSVPAARYSLFIRFIHQGAPRTWTTNLGNAFWVGIHGSLRNRQRESLDRLPHTIFVRLTRRDNNVGTKSFARPNPENFFCRYNEARDIFTPVDFDVELVVCFHTRTNHSILNLANEMLP